MTDAATLAKRLPDHEATLAEIEKRGRHTADSSSWEFESKEDAWWHSAAFELVSGFRSISAEDPNAISTRAMKDRIAEFETIYAHSIGEHRGEWDAAIASIADPAQCPQYKGLKIVPQVGLLPIGRDPKSGMWEFWFVDVTGVKPERGADGRLVLTDDFGLVFVLLPGGTFNMGAQKEDPKAPNYDPMASRQEGPVHPVSLAPFLISKYKVTEGQWVLGSRNMKWPYAFTGRIHPAGSISWDDATTTLQDLCLDLPTEAQWEYAYRGGTQSPWPTGEQAESLSGFVNMNDDSKLDGISPTALIGALLPTAFGLHDMAGITFEWCRDGVRGADGYIGIPQLMTGEHAVDDPRYRSLRGCIDGHDSRMARSASRFQYYPGLRGDVFGVRPRKDLTRD